MQHMSLQSLNLFGHGVEVFSIILLPRGLHSPKSGTGTCCDDASTVNRFKDDQLTPCHHLMTRKYDKEGRPAMQAVERQPGQILERHGL